MIILESYIQYILEEDNEVKVVWSFWEFRETNYSHRTKKKIIKISQDFIINLVDLIN